MNNHVYLRPLELKDAETLLNLKLRNRDFYQSFEPIRDDSHFTLQGTEKAINDGNQASLDDQSYIYGIFLTETDELVGRIALTGIARGAFQNAYMGYYIDQEHNGKGYATAAVILCVKLAFHELGLHRVEAGVMPRNLRSMRVLAKAGFRNEGLAQSYIKINGKWEDHKIFAVTVDEFANF